MPTNTYRMVHTEPLKIIIEMQTVSGWIPTDTATSIAEAKEKIRQRKEKEAWVVKIYDEAGDVARPDVPPDQPVENA